MFAGAATVFAVEVAVVLSLLAELFLQAKNDEVRKVNAKSLFMF
jgi:NADH:ubiquinone oxidoreductase subunit K